MSKSIRAYKNFDDAAADQKAQASMLTPAERIMLLHKLIRVWMKFPRLVIAPDNVPVVKRIK